MVRLLPGILPVAIANQICDKYVVGSARHRSRQHAQQSLWSKRVKGHGSTQLLLTIQLQACVQTDTALPWARTNAPLDRQVSARHPPPQGGLTSCRDLGQPSFAPPKISIQRTDA